MGVFTGIVLYVIIYWLALFAVLPWGNKPPETVEEGHAPGAPANPRIRQKFLVTGLIAAVLWTIVYLLIYFDVMDFYDIARQMTQEDFGQ